MKKVTVAVHRDYVEEVIKKFHETGLVEIIDIIKEDPSAKEETEQGTIDPETETCMTYELRLTRLLDILSKYHSRPRGIKAILHPQIPPIKDIPDRPLQKLSKHTDDVLRELETNIITYEKQINELTERNEKIEQEKEQVSFLTDFQIDLSIFDTSPLIVFKAGRTTDITSIENELTSSEVTTIQSKQIGTGKDKEWVVLIAGHISEKKTIEKICREKITLFSFSNLSGSPKEYFNALTKKQKAVNTEKNKIVSTLTEYSEKHFHDLLALREEFQLDKMRKEVHKNFTKTRYVYLIKGWVLEKNEHTLQTILDDVSKQYIISNFETPSINPDNPPTYLETPKWASTFKTFLHLFSTPKYNELDPTIFMGIFFIICFGLMVGDAGYGLVLLCISIFGYVKFGKHSPMIKDWSFLGILLGAFTIVVGLLMNSLFGDFVQRFFYHDPNRILFQATVLGVKIPIDSLRDPVTVLVIALITGLAHLNLGVALAMVQSIKQKDYKSLLTKNICWVLLQVGGGLLIGYSILKWQFDTPILYMAGILTIVGMLLVFSQAGPIGFFGITGYVGDWLSYARLLSLGLATSALAVTFNIVSEVVSNNVPFIGIIILPVVLVITHTANCVIQMLGAGVHSLRLQYVEFFNRFYEGGGREFAPLHMKRRYTKIEKNM